MDDAEREYAIFAGMEKVYAEEANAKKCSRCGATTLEQAEKICHVSGEWDDCPGVYIWPD